MTFFLSTILNLKFYFTYKLVFFFSFRKFIKNSFFAKNYQLGTQNQTLSSKLTKRTQSTLRTQLLESEQQDFVHSTCTCMHEILYTLCVLHVQSLKFKAILPQSGIFNKSKSCFVGRSIVTLIEYHYSHKNKDQ